MMNRNPLIPMLFLVVVLAVPTTVVHARLSCEVGAGLQGSVMGQDPAAGVEITYSQGVLYVVGAEGSVLEIVSLTGRKMLGLLVESPAQKVELNIPKGCYIVKVGSVVRKISVR